MRTEACGKGEAIVRKAGNLIRMHVGGIHKRRFQTGFLSALFLSQAKRQAKDSCLPLFLQPKLAISRPGDPAEMEADRVADQVMRMPESGLQRQCAACEEEEAVTVSRKAQGAIGGDAPASVGSVIRSPGQPLASSTRAFFEPRFGQDLSHVRVHTDGEAQQSARDVNAMAYTVGPHVVFDAGRYAPGTPHGQRLLAHELTHVVQQTGANRGLGKQNNQGSNLLPIAHLGQPRDANRYIQRKVEVPSGVDVEFFSKNTEKAGNIYSYPEPIRDKGLDLEMFTSLFSSPRIFKLKGISSKDVESSFFRQMEARKGVVDFASNKKYAFVGGEAGFKMNSKYWEWGGGRYWSKEGVDLEEARADLNVNPQEYAIGCAAATKLTVKAGGKSESIEGTTFDPKDWVPGESGFIENKKWDGTPGLQGENIIYMGAKQFWGHFASDAGKAIKGYQQWFDQVNNWPNRGGAELSSDRTYPEKGLKR